MQELVNEAVNLVSKEIVTASQTEDGRNDTTNLLMVSPEVACIAQDKR